MADPRASHRYQRITQADVAKKAGVSGSTVSRVLSGRDAGIPEVTRRRVLEAAKGMNYRRNAIAAGLRLKTTDTIGFISDVIATTPHAGAMVQGAQDAAWDHGKLLLLVNTGGDPEVEARAIHAMLDRQVDGLIYATMYHQYRDVPSLLEYVPSVLLDVQSPLSQQPSVLPDEYSAAHAATTYLLSLGHRSIGFVNSNADIPAARERRAGYLAALLDADIACGEDLMISDIDEYDGGARCATTLLARPDPPTALYCFNDRMAAGVLRAARRLGVRVPEDLSVVGTDNQELVALMTEPPLTTFQLPHYEMGRRAVEELIGLVPGASARVVAVPLTLVERSSAGRRP